MIYFNFVLYTLAIFLLLKSIMIIPERQSWVIQRLGKFNRISLPGLKFKIPFIETIASKENLRIQQLDVDVETKTLDDVFVILKISVQYRIISEKVFEAFYELDDPHGQIASYIFDEVRAEVPKLGLDDVFGKKDDVAMAVRENISQQMEQYGYKIVKTLITDINPDELVKASMNKINAATRDKEAAFQEAEGEKIRIVKRAEAEADSKRLSGEGIAAQRLEIVRGFKESVEDFQKALQDVDPQEIMQFVLMTQYFDTLTAIGANDDVNMSQSSNDVIPTAICISSLLDMERLLLPNLDILIDAIDAKMKEVKGNVKTGRTHLMDAMPIDFSQELSGWKAQLTSSKKSLKAASARMLELPQGGTAIGTGINTHKDFSKHFCSEVNALTGLKTKQAKNFFQGLSSVDNAVELSSAVKNLSVVLMKISNDLRWMNSGPLTGLSEIELEALQPGSSIMPGKVNPVIPEAVAMACADVIGNDTTITIAGQSGNFQLNVMLPVVAYNLLKSITLMANSMPLLANKAIKTFKVNTTNIEESLSKNPILVTALNRKIGYVKAAAVAKKAYKEKRSIIDVAHEETGISLDELSKLLDPSKLTKGGIN